VKSVDLEDVRKQAEDTCERNPVPVIPHLAEISNAYRSSVGDPSSGVMFTPAVEIRWTSAS
jgi:hypothetical protein